MARSGSSYKLSLLASVNEQSITSQLDRIAKNYKFVLDVTLSAADLQKFQQQVNNLQNQISKGSKNVEIFDRKRIVNDVHEIQNYFQNLRRTVDEFAKIKMFAPDGGDFANKAVITYKNDLGQVVTETHKLMETENERGEKVKKWYLDQATALDDVASRERQHSQALAENLKFDKQRADEFERMALNADKFLQRSKDLKGPNVTKAVDVANNLKGAISEGNIDAARKYNRELEVLNSGIKQAGKNALSFGNEMKVAITRTIEWGMSIGLVYGALQRLRDGIQFVKDLDKEMRNIQIVTGMTDEKAKDLAASYNSLAKQMGATTVQVAEGSLQWIRQGKTIEETQELLKSTMMLSKLGAVDSAEATDYLTSVLNAYKLEAEDAVGVVDRLVSVDNAAATSVAELATGLQRSSVSAQQAGVSIEELTAMIGVTSSVTRRSAASLGEAFKTMFARFQDIQKGKIDEDGMGINNVGAALERVNINIREANGDFKDFSVVLKELYGVWGDLNEVEQANIAKAIAGVRQRETLLVLLENETMYRKLLLEQENSEGLAMDRYKTYLGGVEAAQNRLQASWEKLYTSLTDNNTITFFYNLTSTILETIDAFGGFKPIILGVVSAFTILKGQAIAAAFSSMVGAIESVIASLAALRTGAIATGTTLTTALGGIGLAIAAVGIAYSLASKAIESNQEIIDRTTKVVEEHRDALKSLEGQQKNIRELGVEYESLVGKSRNTSDEQERFLEIQNKIKDILPGVAGHYDALGNFILDTTTKASDLNDELEKQIDNEKALIAATAKEGFGAKLKEYDKQIDKLNKLDEKYKDMKDSMDLVEEVGMGPFMDMPSYTTQDLFKTDADKQQAIKDQQEMLDGLRKDWALFDEETRKYFVGMLNNMGDTGKAILKELSDSVEGVNNTIASGLTDQNIKDAEKEFEGLYSVIKQINEETSDLNSMLEKSKDTGLDSSDVESLLEKNADYIKFLDIEGDKITLNAEKVKEYNLAKIDQAIATAQATHASQQEIDVLTALRDQIKNGITDIKSMQEAYNDILDIIIDKIKQEKDAEKELLQDKLDALKEKLDADKEAIKEGLDAEKERIDAEKDAIEDGLDATKKKYDQEKELIEQSIKETEKKTKAEKDALEDQLEALEASYKAQKDALEEEQDALDKKHEAEKKAIDDELKGYKKIIDARLKAIEAAKEELDYQDELADRQKAISDIRGELAELEFDDSEEAMRRRAELQDELAQKEKEMEKYTRDHSYEEQKSRIEQELEDFEALSAAKQEALEAEYEKQKEISEDKTKVIEAEYEAQKAIIEENMELLDKELEAQKEVQQTKIETLEKEYEAIESNSKARIDALDAEYKIQEKLADQKIKALEDEYKTNEDIIKQQIKTIDDYLEQTGRLRTDAIALLASEGQGFYDQLLEWNRTYGTGIDTDITAKWDLAKQAAQDYLNTVNGIPSTSVNLLDSGQVSDTNEPVTEDQPFQSYHSGVDVGFVGNKPQLKSNEEFAKLMNGELVSTPQQMDQFMTRTLPEIVNNNNSVSAPVTFENLLNLTVEGNMAENMLPKLKNMIEDAFTEFNKSMMMRGKTRNAASFAA